MIVAAVDKKIWRPEGGVARKGEYESYTSISKYKSCPVNHYKYYIAYGREPVGPPLLLGRAVHETIASVLLEKLFRGVDLPLEVVDETFHHKWNVELYLAKTQPGGINWEGLPSPQQQEERGRQLVRHWARDILPEIQPKAIEEPFQARLKDVEQFLYGRFDLVTQSGFTDDKTANHDYADSLKDRYRLQMGIYYVGYLDRYRQWPQEVTLTWLNTTGNLDVYMVDYSLTKSEVQQMVNEIIKPMMQGIAKSKSTGLWICTCGKHKDIDKARVDADKAAERKQREEEAKILNPQMKEATSEAVTVRSSESITANDLPFETTAVDYGVSPTEASGRSSES